MPELNSTAVILAWRGPKNPPGSVISVRGLGAVHLTLQRAASDVLLLVAQHMMATGDLPTWADYRPGAGFSSDEFSLDSSNVIVAVTFGWPVPRVLCLGAEPDPSMFFEASAWVGLLSIAEVVRRGGDLAARPESPIVLPPPTAMPNEGKPA